MCSCLLALRRIRKSDDQMRGKRRLVHHPPPSNVFISSSLHSHMHPRITSFIVQSILSSLAVQYHPCRHYLSLNFTTGKLHLTSDHHSQNLVEQSSEETAAFDTEPTFDCSKMRLVCRICDAAGHCVYKYARTAKERNQIIIVSVLSTVIPLAIAAAIAYTCVRHNKKKREFQRQVEEATGPGEAGQATGVVGADSAEP